MPISNDVFFTDYHSSSYTPRKILVVGDSMLDIWKIGHTSESCQEGCSKFKVEKEIRTPGGAANAARQLANWNCEVNLLSIIGHPGCMQSIPHSSSGRGISFQVGMTPQKTRYLVDDRIIFRDDREFPDYDLNPDQIAKFRRLAIATFRETIPLMDAVLISDYDKGFMDREMIRQIIRMCEQLDIPCVADAKRAPSHYEGSIVKCNRTYADKHPYDHPGQIFLVTDGASPPYITDQRVTTFSEKVPCLNHVGAGDCFAAHLAFALAHTLDGVTLHDAAAISHSAGRVFVQHRYSRPPHPHEIRRDLLGTDARGKILRREDAAMLQESLSDTSVRKGNITFTNGVFRLPHAGHAWLMNWAKKAAEGGPLIVGVNTDESAKRIRGTHTDFTLPLDERMMMLASMEAVDWVIPFSEGEDSPMELMRDLRPEILVKGPEYAEDRDNVPGADMAKLMIAGESPFPAHARHLIDAIREKPVT